MSVRNLRTMRRTRSTALRLEELERRDQPSGVVHIDAAMVQQANGGPIYLTQASTQYVLDVDMDVAGAAFVVGAANVTLNLNGHTVIYGDSAPINVPNGGFEQGTGTSVPNWNLASAPSARIASRITGMWGSQMLQLASFTSKQTLWSSNISIPTANREYAAAITPSGTYGATVTLTVVDAVTGKTLASASSQDPNRGFSAVALFTPTTTNAIKLRVDVAPPAGQSATVDLDYAAVMPSRDFGVVATQTWYTSLPAQLVTSQFKSVYQNAANFTIETGHLIQGAVAGYASDPMYFQCLSGFTVNNVDSLATGMDTDNLDANWGLNAVIQNSIFRGAINRISDRMNIYAAINLANFSGTASVVGNQITGVPQVGVMCNGLSTETSLVIDNNTIQQSSIVTDGYGVLLAGVQNFDVGGNRITPTNGRGILVDGWGRIATVNGSIHDNYVSVMEGPNLEYDYNSLEATALRFRNWSATFKSITVSNNTFMATTGPGLDHAAQGARISETNDQGQLTGANNIFQNNVFKAVVTTTDSHYGAYALSISGVGAGTGLQFAGNTFQSNDTSLRLGDNDSWQGVNDDISFTGNTFALTTDGPARTYTALLAGSYQNEVSNVRLYDSYTAYGATMTEVFQGPATPASIQIGWQMLAAGADYGAAPEVKVYNGLTGAVRFDFLAYDHAFLGGVRVATGDVTGDGVPDIVTAPGTNGGPQINVYDGNTGQLVRAFMAYSGSATYGVYVAVGDVNHDGYADIITGLDKGGTPEVKVFSGKDNSVLYDFLAYASSFRGGVRVAAGDVNDDNFADILTGAGPGGGPHVEVWSGHTGALLQSFMAFKKGYTAGVFVSAGDVNGDGYADLITSAGGGGGTNPGPRVKIWDGRSSLLLGTFLAYDPTFSGGARVGIVHDMNRNGQVDIVVAPGGGTNEPVKIFDGVTLALLDNFYAFGSGNTGVYVGGV